MTTIQNFLGIDSAKDLCQAAQIVLNIQKQAIKDLAEVKVCIVEDIKSKNRIYYWGIGCLLFIVVGLILFQQYMKKIYQLRFNKIIAESTIKSNDISTISESKYIINYEKPLNNIKTSSIGEDIVNLILIKLDDFENKKGFLDNKVSIKTLSEDFETNSKYLSKVVNEYKSKTFINYINDLRIDYAIVELQQNKTARKYTLQALAIEYGFNNAESFSTAFSKKTGLKPSYFIKELENN